MRGSLKRLIAVFMLFLHVLSIAEPIVADKNKNIYALINELENKYIERGYVTTKVGLNTEKSDFENGNISLFV